PLRPTLSPYTTLFRPARIRRGGRGGRAGPAGAARVRCRPGYAPDTGLRDRRGGVRPRPGDGLVDGLPRPGHGAGGRAAWPAAGGAPREPGPRTGVRHPAGARAPPRVEPGRPLRHRTRPRLRPQWLDL